MMGVSACTDSAPQTGAAVSIMAAVIAIKSTFFILFCLIVYRKVGQSYE